MNPDFDYAKFSARKRLKLREVADKIGASVGLVGNWNSKAAVPSYEKLGKLIEMGMTAQEMFGEELGELLITNSSEQLATQETTEADFNERVRKFLLELLADKKA